MRLGEQVEVDRREVVGDRRKMSGNGTKRLTSSREHVSHVSRCSQGTYVSSPIPSNKALSKSMKKFEKPKSCVT